VLSSSHGWLRRTPLTVDSEAHRGFREIVEEERAKFVRFTETRLVQNVPFSSPRSLQTCAQKNTSSKNIENRFSKQKARTLGGSLRKHSWYFSSRSTSESSTEVGFVCDVGNYWSRPINLHFEFVKRKFPHRSTLNPLLKACCVRKMLI
jgi:hypothetical protein